MIRRYSENEVHKILAEAVDAGPDAIPDTGDGLTLEEIKEIGVEVGIDPVHVERAARSVAPSISTSTREFTLAGAPTSMALERQVPGEFDAGSASEILAVIRRGTGRMGNVAEVGGMLEWRAEGELGERVITLSTRRGVTTISGMADLKNAAVVTFLPASFVGLFASILGFIQAADSGNEIGMLFFVALMPMLLFTLRMIFRRVARSEWTRLEQVADELVALVGTQGAPGNDPEEQT